MVGNMFFRLLSVLHLTVAPSCFAKRQPVDGLILLQKGTSVAAGPTPVEQMIDKYQQVIEDLGVEVLQCQEGISKLHNLEKPYVINAMLTAVGPKADACSLAGGFDVHKEPPTEETDVCVIHCGEDTCPASLTYMENNKDVMKKNCRSVVYLLGGAKCFFESMEPQKDSAGCGAIVEPHHADEFKFLVTKLDIKEIQCSEEALSDFQNPYIINMMISTLGADADACSLSGHTVHAEPPTAPENSCVLFCGEDNCPFALPFLLKNEAVLKDNCGKLAFFKGGAKCFLENKVPIKDEARCSQIVIG